MRSFSIASTRPWICGGFGRFCSACTACSLLVSAAVIDISSCGRVVGGLAAEISEKLQQTPCDRVDGRRLADLGGKPAVKVDIAGGTLHDAGQISRVIGADVEAVDAVLDGLSHAANAACDHRTAVQPGFADDEGCVFPPDGGHDHPVDL